LDLDGGGLLNGKVSNILTWNNFGFEQLQKLFKNHITKNFKFKSFLNEIGRNHFSSYEGQNWLRNIAQEGKAMQKVCITCKYSFTCQTTGHGYRHSSTRWSCWKED
jgi:hypothetical protein